MAEQKILAQPASLSALERSSFESEDSESIRRFPDQDTLLGMMREAGLEDCRYENLSGGIVALHRGFRY